MLRQTIIACCVTCALPGYAACPSESQLTHILNMGVELSPPLTTSQVEALVQTGPGFSEVSGVKPYGRDNSEWQDLKSKQRQGDYFVQFWRSEALVKRTKFYMDGLYLVRNGCVVGWLKGAVS